MDKENKIYMRKEFLEHISKEIVTTINNTYVFRTRSAFTVWIGPFIVLGSVIIARKFNIPTFTSWLWYAVGVSVVTYMVLGCAAGLIEEANWNRVVYLRGELAKLSQSEDETIDIEKFKNAKKKWQVLGIYMFVFVSILILFVCATIIVTHLKT